MTPDERAYGLWLNDQGMTEHTRRAITDAIRAAVEEEREACAKMVEEHLSCCTPVHLPIHIRARGWK